MFERNNGQRKNSNIKSFLLFDPKKKEFLALTEKKIEKLFNKNVDIFLLVLLF